jgi:PPOX class probable F420-dependent enzyme
MSVPTAARLRLERFLASEPVVWLSTVRPDGAPHLVPVWFTWDGEALTVYSKPTAQKVRNARGNPRVMLALGAADEDFDVSMAEARVELLEGPVSQLPDAHLRKYGQRMAALGLTPDAFRTTYSQVMRIVPTRELPWHGRSTPASVQAVASIDEPRNEVVVATSGEPVPATPWLPGPAAPTVEGFQHRVRDGVRSIRHAVWAGRRPIGAAGAA